MSLEQQPDKPSGASPARSIPPPDLSRPSSPPEPPRAERAAAVKVRIRTGDQENDVESPTDCVASFNPRANAMAVDLVVAAGLIVGLYFLLPDFAHPLSWLAGLAYLVTRDSLPFLGGQSVGKKAMKLRAVTLEGKPMTGDWRTSLIRSGVLIIPFFQLVELWLLLSREDGPERGKRLGDEWAGTKVIVEAKPAAPEMEE